MALNKKNTGIIVPMRNQATAPIVLFLFLMLLSAFIVPYVISHAFAQEKVEEIKETAEEKKELINRLKREIEVFEQSIMLRKSQAASLTNQIAILNEEIQKLELSNKLTQEEIDLVKSSIASTEEEIAHHTKTLAMKRNELAQALRSLHAKEGAQGVFILLAHDTVSDYFSDIERIEQLQTRIAAIVGEVERLKLSAEKKKTELDTKEKELLALKQQLEENQERLTGQKVVKAQMLVDTRRSKNRYQLQLDQAKREQRAIESEVVTLEKRLREEIAKGERKKKLDALGSPNFQWPVRGIITSYFHDPDYPYRYIFEHPAIDIATRQGTLVRAAAGGYVAKVKNGGLRGYSYIMLIHNNGYATVYGHLSKLSVRDDQFVDAGDIIGYSGGTPGTPGAGGLTTGPHLHFEIRINGIPVDPLSYL